MFDTNLKSIHNIEFKEFNFPQFKQRMSGQHTRFHLK